MLHAALQYDIFFPSIIFHLCIVLGCSSSLAKLDISADFHTVQLVKFIIKKYLIIPNCRGRAGNSKYNTMKTSMAVKLWRKSRTAELCWFSGYFHPNKCHRAGAVLSHNTPVSFWASPCAKGASTASSVLRQCI